MTICIATMCENKYIVMASDRMLTLTLPSIEFEADSSKSKEVTKNCIVATSGSAIAYTPIFQAAAIDIMREHTSNIGRIAELTRNQYEQARTKKMNEDIFSTYGLNLQNFYQINNALQPQLVALITQRMQEYNYFLWILLAGVDDNGPHIFRIENPASLNSFDAIGYHAIGSGDIHAISTFIVNKYSLKDTSLQRGLALTYEAKKRSEKAQGVGEQTDMYVISKDDVTHLPENAITELNKVYQKRIEQENKVLSEVEQNISDLDIVKKYVPGSSEQTKGIIKG